MLIVLLLSIIGHLTRMMIEFALKVLKEIRRKDYDKTSDYRRKRPAWTRHKQSLQRQGRHRMYQY